MGFFLLVAVYAIRTGFAKFDLLQLPVWLVAAFAACGLVGAAQLEIGQIMIKIFPIKADNVRLPALVVGMAEFALPARHLLQPAMQPRLVTHIACHLLVAVQAQSLLQLLVKGLMAFCTFLLQFSMPLCQLTGGNQPLKYRLRRCR